MVEKRKKYISKLSNKEKTKISIIINKIINWNIKDIDIKKIKWYKNLYRIRIWDLRIVFKNIDWKNYIEYIKPRWDIYKDL